MDLINQAEQYITNLFKDALAQDVYTYHNLNHTVGVVEAVKKMAQYENISYEDTEKLLLAAWFHDIGYLTSCQNHEKHSVESFENWANSKIDIEKINAISELILITQMDKVPQNKLEAIIKDADYYHFTLENYKTFSENLRLEIKLSFCKTFTDLEWLNENLIMLSEKHKYYTSFAKEFWEPLKEQNIKRLKKEIKKSSNEKENKVAKESKNNKTERGVDTMFRVTLGNHTRLSEIADSKANILLSVNAIIISIALSTLIPKLDSPTNSHLILPTFILVLFSVVTIIFAILSTRPKVTSGTFTDNDVREKKVNLLFFGNFYKMPYEQYEEAVNQMMNDKEYLYNSMIKDLYYLGLVLERKYRLLRVTYHVFMIGIIVSVIAFVLAFKFSGY